MAGLGGWRATSEAEAARPRRDPADLGSHLARILRLPIERRQLRLRAIRDGLVVSGLLCAAFILAVIPSVGHSLGYDAYAYWAVDLSGLYDRTQLGQAVLGGFRYGPPIGQLFALIGALPWWAFLTLWMALLWATLVWLGGRWWLCLLALPPVALELEHGNVHLLMAAAVALGFRYPWTWSFVILTKVTPGVGLIWFAMRREWRSLAIALGATLAVSAVSFVLAPGLWREWIDALTVNAGQSQDFSVPPPLVIRLPLAVALVAWGAATDRPWTVGVSAMLALPILWVHGLAVALAAVPFLRRNADRRRAADPESAKMRFISLRELLAPDRHPSNDFERAASPRGYLVAIGAGLVIAVTVILAAGPLLRELVGWASGNIVPPGP